MRPHTLLALILAGLALTACGNDPSPRDTARFTGSAPTSTTSPAAAEPSTTPPPAEEDAASTTRHSPTTQPTPDSRPTGGAGSPEGLEIDPGTVEETDLDQISQALGQTMLASDTTLDRTRTDAYRRASQWMTPATAKQYTSSTVRGTDAAWLELEAHDGYTTVTLEDPVAAGQPPGSTDTEGMRAYYATVTPRGRDGWEGTTTRYQLMLVMTRDQAGDPWRAEIINLVPEGTR